MRSWNRTICNAESRDGKNDIPSKTALKIFIRFSRFKLIKGILIAELKCSFKLALLKKLLRNYYEKLIFLVEFYLQF